MKIKDQQYCQISFIIILFDFFFNSSKSKLYSYIFTAYPNNRWFDVED